MLLQTIGTAHVKESGWTDLQVWVIWKYSFCHAGLTDTHHSTYPDIYMDQSVLHTWIKINKTEPGFSVTVCVEKQEEKDNKCSVIMANSMQKDQ